ncbi:MAG: nucleotidyltransferase domain-containing protein [Spartobacteria bacterium]|nr:nucleotidyltransferase domain-containing protein [Spartobacteria bacterium]
MSRKPTAATTNHANGAKDRPAGRGGDPAGFESQSARRDAEIPIRVHPRASVVGSAAPGAQNATFHGLTPFQLDNRLIEPIVAAVTAGKPVRRIWLFGSRAAGAARPASDVDLAVEADNWSDLDTNLAHDRLEAEVPTVLKFDLVDLNAVAKPRFREAIQRQGRLIYET